MYHCVHMKRYIHNTQQGFIALFFTLSMSATLLAYVAMSSTSVFDYMRTRDEFIDVRSARQHSLECADMFIDMIVRSLVYDTSSIAGCSIHSVSVDQIQRDILTFYFMSDELYVTGTIKNGFVTKVLSSNSSL